MRFSCSVNGSTSGQVCTYMGVAGERHMLPGTVHRRVPSLIGDVP